MNNELKQYHKILCDEYPEFIDKYIYSPELQRISYIDQFCGAKYTNLFQIKYWYSRLDHSISVALMTYHFTKDKVQTLAALFHDLGTPCFSHCIDYLLNDSVNQKSSEKDIYDVIVNSDIKDLLASDQIDYHCFKDISIYPVVENEKPRICVDRLDGVLTACLVWIHYFDLDKIKDIYHDLILLNNEDNKPEIGFKSLEKCESFFDGVYEYSMALQKNDDKFFMQYMADSLKCLIDNNDLSFNDLYQLKEIEIIDMLKNKVNSWNQFEITTNVISTDNHPGQYYVSVESKKRYVDPLVKIGDKVVRLSSKSDRCQRLLDNYMNFHDKKYAYVKEIKKMN